MQNDGSLGSHRSITVGDELQRTLQLSEQTKFSTLNEMIYLPFSLSLSLSFLKTYTLQFGHHTLQIPCGTRFVQHIVRSADRLF